MCTTAAPPQIVPAQAKECNIYSPPRIGPPPRISAAPMGTYLKLRSRPATRCSSVRNDSRTTSRTESRNDQSQGEIPGRFKRSLTTRCLRRNDVVLVPPPSRQYTRGSSASAGGPTLLTTSDVDHAGGKGSKNFDFPKAPAPHLHASAGSSTCVPQRTRSGTACGGNKGTIDGEFGERRQLSRGAGGFSRDLESAEKPSFGGNGSYDAQLSDVLGAREGDCFYDEDELRSPLEEHVREDESAGRDNFKVSSEKIVDRNTSRLCPYVVEVPPMDREKSV